MKQFHTIRLTDIQKELLIRIYTSATPELAYAETQYGDHHIAAAEILSQLGAIERSENATQVTLAGKELMRQQGLIDGAGDLTEISKPHAVGDGSNRNVVNLG